MSRTFEGLEEAVLSDREERYEPGRFTRSQDIVNEIAARFQEGTLYEVYYDPLSLLFRRYGHPAIEWHRRNCATEIEALIESRVSEQFRPDDFLHSLLSEVACWSKTGNTGILLDAAVQALYDLGYNGFSLDLSRLPQEKPYNVAWQLRGTEERKLKVTYHGDVQSFGYNVRHCELELHGECVQGGEWAEKSTLSFKGEVARVGEHGKESSYHFRSSAAGRIGNDAFDSSYHIHDGSRTKPFFWELHQWIDKDIASLNKSLKQDDFWRRNNTLWYHFAKRGEEAQW